MCGIFFLDNAHMSHVVTFFAFVPCDRMIKVDGMRGRDIRIMSNIS